MLSYPGELFMRFLKLIILPLIISSLVAGSASLNATISGKIVLRTLIYFFVTSLTNAVLGIFLVTAIQPGNVQMESAIRHAQIGTGSKMIDSLLDLGRYVLVDAADGVVATFFLSGTS